MIKRVAYRILRFILQHKCETDVTKERQLEENLVMRSIPESCLSSLSDAEKSEVKMLFSPIGDVNSFKELALFKYHNGFDSRYVSHYMYLPLIARRLNDYQYTQIFEHKSLLGFLVNKGLSYPTCFVRCIDSEYYDADMLQITEADVINICAAKNCLLVKDSSGTSGGGSIQIIELSHLSLPDREERIRQVLNERKNDFVIQEIVKQHESTAKFNRTSINTFRITTLYLNGKFSTLSVVFRFGKTGMTVDNWGRGGIIIGVSPTGDMYERGYDIYMNEYTEYNGINFSEQHFEFIPSLLEAVELAHKYSYPLCKLIGWDICYRENGLPVVIEVNSSQPGLIGEQLCTGPIFGDRTQEVIDYCSHKRFIYNKSLFKY